MLVYGIHLWYWTSIFWLTPVRTRYPLTSITWSYRGLKLKLTEVSSPGTGFRLDCKVNSPEHKRGFILRALSVARRGYTAILYINESSYTVNAFRVQVENGFSFCIFRWFQSSLTYDICGRPWWLRGYSSQASAGCKLKAVFNLNLLRAGFFSLLQLAYL